MLRAYHFVGDALRNGQPVPPDGEWLEYDGPLPLVMCERGLHASQHPMDALKYAPGQTICLVDLDGEILHDTDKCVATRRRIIKRADATELLRRFARRCALDVIHLWDAPKIIREYLETGNESIRAAARDAAWAAARAAAGNAAWAASWASARAAAGNAAWDAAWDAALDSARGAARGAASAAARSAAGKAEQKTQRERFQAMVDELLR